jgi:hypothetical protein
MTPDPVLHYRVVIMQEMGRRRVGMYEYFDNESSRFICAEVFRLGDDGEWQIDRFEDHRRDQARQRLRLFLSEEMRLDPAGIVYMVFAWLSQQKVPLTFGADECAVLAANMAKTFCEANQLGDPREGFQDDFVPMGTTPLGPIAEQAANEAEAKQ